MSAQRVDHRLPQDGSLGGAGGQSCGGSHAGSVASLAGAPQVSILVVTDSYAIGLGLLAAPGNDSRLLALTELLAS